MNQTPQSVAPPIREVGGLPQLVFALSLLLALSVPGCATRSANPSQARANTGYMDFHADSSDELGWDVARFDDGAQSFKTVFSELEPPAGGVLRLAFPPGHYRVRVTFLNRVVREPAIAEVDVKDGMITPVRVVLAGDGTALVQRKEQRLGGTAYGRYGRRTKISNNETAMYGLSAVAAPPVAYQLKEQMPYAR